MPPRKSPKDKRAQTVIEKHVLLAMGAGFIPVPLADLAALATLQVRLVSALGEVYHVPNVEPTRSKTIITTLFRSLGLTTIAVGGIGSLSKVAPILGTLFGTSTIAALSGSLTYATGVIFKNHFAQGGTLENFDLTRQREHFKRAFNTGKRITKRYKPGETPPPDEDIIPEPDPYELLPIYCIFKPKLGRSGKVYLKSYVEGKRPEKYIGAMDEMKERYKVEDLNKVTSKIITDHRQQFLDTLREKKIIEKARAAESVQSA